MREDRILKELEIASVVRLYAVRGAKPEAEGAAPAEPTAVLEPRTSSLVAAMDWSELRETVRLCTACGLCRQRKQAVFGVGAESARLRTR